MYISESMSEIYLRHPLLDLFCGFKVLVNSFLYIMSIKVGTYYMSCKNIFFVISPGHFTRENCKDFVRGTFYFFVHLEPLEGG